MTSIFAIQATVKQSHKPKMVKYFHQAVSYPVTGTDSITTEFFESPAKATMFETLEGAIEAFDWFVNASVGKPVGKTMFEPPFSILVGGEHCRRTVTTKIELVQISGVSLGKSVVNVVKEISLRGEEYDDGTPFTIVQFEPWNIELRDNKVGTYNLIPPKMWGGDEYLDTFADTTNQRIQHEARSVLGHVVIYTCTMQGNLLHRVEQAPPKNIAAPMTNPGYLG